MQQFSYKARDATGKGFVGTVEAGDTQAASKLLNERGLVVVKLVSRGGIVVFLRSINERVGLGDLASFTRQLSTMITAGVTILEALSILRTQVGRGMAVVVDQLLLEIEGGSSLAASLEKHPSVFSPVYASLIRAGETGGVLDNVLARLADNLEREREFRAKVKAMLIYPVIVVIGMVMVAILMLVFVLPRLTQIYEQFNAQLPLSTRIIISLSNFLTHFWWLVALIVGLVVWGFIMFRKTPVGKQKTDELLLKTPLIGPLVRQIALTDFVRTLGLLVGAGVSILEALNVVARVMGNEVLSAGVRDAAKDVEKGFPLAWALAQHPDAFPPVMVRMLAVGEETGKLDEVLNKISHSFDVESEQNVRALTSAIEPIILIILGIGVGVLVVSIILPIYNLTSQF